MILRVKMSYLRFRVMGNPDFISRFLIEDLTDITEYCFSGFGERRNYKKELFKVLKK
jgi:hypothetical protein